MQTVSSGAAQSPGRDLEFRGVTKLFGANRVLDGVNLAVRPGEFLTLLGPSGCGKSTLLRIAAGLEEASSGEVFIGGRAVDHLPPKARGVAMVFQNYALYPHMTVFQNIATPLRMGRLNLAQRLPFLGPLLPGTRKTAAQIREDVRSAGRTVGIESLLDRKPGQLSGGQRQRVALGRAIVRSPSVFLMDEPLSNLDAALRAQMRLELAKLHHSLQATFVYVTHDQVEAMTLSDRVAVVMNGTILQVDAPDVVYGAPSHLDVARFVGSPAINVLAGRVRRDAGIDVQGICFPGGPALTPGTALRIGVRAEDIEPAAPDAPAWSGVVRHVENLGPDLLVHVSLDDAEPLLVMRTDRRRYAPPAPGETVSLHPAGPVHVFSGDGKRVASLSAEQTLVPA